MNEKPKLIRKLDTPENIKFWEHAEKNAKEVATWPKWKKHGLNDNRYNNLKKELPNNENNNSKF